MTAISIDVIVAIIMDGYLKNLDSGRQEGNAMKDVQDFIPITKAKNELLDLIRRVENQDDTIAITKNGVPSAIIMSMEKFEGLLETLDILSDESTIRLLRKAIQESKEDKWLSLEEVFK